MMIYELAKLFIVGAAVALVFLTGRYVRRGFTLALMIATVVFLACGCSARAAEPPRGDIKFIDGNNRTILTMTADRRIVVAKGVKPDAAAREFLRVLAQLYPQYPCVRPEIKP